MKSTIDINDIKELRSACNPSESMQILMEAVHILFKDKKALWQECKIMMSDHKGLKQQMDEYDTSKVTPSMKEKLKVIVERPDFTIERMRNSSKACVGIFQWVMEVYSSS